MTDLQVFSATAMTVVLFAAAWAKLRAPDRFARALRSYEVIPQRTIPVLVVAVPVAELVFATLQWIDSLQPIVGIALVLMLVAFTVLLLRSLAAGKDADCGCFGSAVPEKVSWFSVLRNIVLIGLALVGALAAGGSPGAGAVAAGVTGLGVGVIILVADQGVVLISGPRS